MTKKIFTIACIASILATTFTMHSCKKDVPKETNSSSNINENSSLMTVPNVCSQVSIDISEIKDVGRYHNEGLDYLNEHLDTNILYSYTDTADMIKYIGSVSKDYVKSISFQPVLDLQSIGMLDETLDAALDPTINVSLGATEQSYVNKLDSIMDSYEDTILNIAPLEALMVDVENDGSLDNCAKSTLLSAVSVAISSAVYWHEFAHETANYTGNDGLNKRWRRVVGRFKAAFRAVRTAVRVFTKAVAQGANWTWQNRWKLAKIAKTVWAVVKADAKGQVKGATKAFMKFGLKASAGGPKAVGAVILVGGLVGAVAYSGTAAFLDYKLTKLAEGE